MHQPHPQRGFGQQTHEAISGVFLEEVGFEVSRRVAVRDELELVLPGEDRIVRVREAQTHGRKPAGNRAALAPDSHHYVERDAVDD